MIAESAVEEFRTSLRGQLLLPDQPGYDESRKVFKAVIYRHPAMIVRCAGVADVTSAVRFARSQNVVMAVRVTGHDVAGIRL